MMGPLPLIFFDKLQTTILEYQKSVLYSFDSGLELTLVVGYEKEQVIEKYSGNVRIIENPNFTAGDTEGLRLGLNSVVAESLLIIDGNTIFDDIDLYSLTSSGRNTVGFQDGDTTEIGVMYSLDKIYSFCFGTNNRTSGMYYFNSEGISQLRQAVAYSPDNYKIYEILNKITDFFPCHQPGVISLRKAQDLC